MRHNISQDEMREKTALYALGALSQHEAHIFEEHIAEGCDFCHAELGAFEQVVNAIALDAGEEEPSPDVRDKLIAAINDTSNGNDSKPAKAKRSEQKTVSIRSNDGKWMEAQEGIFCKPLYFDKASGMATSLVRMGPGTSLTAHKHEGVEQFFILEGDCNVCGEILGPGDYHRAPAGTIHESTSTVNGTMFLLVAPLQYEGLKVQ
ncbi:MAG TPA: cupin domain-containing protein [Blastocatellia bacterium]|nr:cupin domain-containing protein [Blastocatellia bacterium]